MNIYEYTIADSAGHERPLSTYAGSVVLIVNTASKCGFTPQFEGLEKLYETYRERGFVVLGFPCNQFGQQDPGSTADSVLFCQKNYGVHFPMMEKIEVNGQNTHPLYRCLKSQKKGLLGGTIKWNFTKFLIDRGGNVVKRYAPNVEPQNIGRDIEKLLEIKTAP